MFIVKKHRSEILSITNPVEGVYTLELKSLSGKFKYKPGQFLHLSVDEYDPSSAWPDSRCFSIQSSPDAQHIKITYSVKGDFTRRMEKELKTGKEVWLKLPFGDLFTQDHNKNNTVFIAGGTGITPFLSLFTDPDFAAYQHPVLYAGFRDASFNFYNDDLQKAQQLNKDMVVVPFYQDKDGVIDIAGILEKSDKQASFFISGPPAMIKHFKAYLIGQGVDEEQIKTDDWE